MVRVEGEGEIKEFRTVVSTSVPGDAVSWLE
jgi:hypothetical protein